jgi:hypothetical protein
MSLKTRNRKKRLQIIRYQLVIIVVILTVATAILATTKNSTNSLLQPPSPLPFTSFNSFPSSLSSLIMQLHRLSAQVQEAKRVASDGDQHRAQLQAQVPLSHRISIRESVLTKTASHRCHVRDMFLTIMAGDRDGGSSQEVRR